MRCVGLSGRFLRASHRKSGFNVAADFLLHLAFQSRFGILGEFDSSAGEDMEGRRSGGLEEYAVVAPADSGDAILEAFAVVFEGDHLPEYLNKKHCEDGYNFVP